MITNNQGKSAKHSGDAGDIIYSIPTVLGLKVNQLYVDPFGGLTDPLVKWADKKQTKLNYKVCVQLKELFYTQDYKFETKIMPDEIGTDYNLNLFRKHIKYNNLSDSHLAAFNLPFTLRDNAWIKIKDPNPVSKIVISRSVRYHGNYAWWESMLPLIMQHNPIFVGHPKEHEIFEYTFGKSIQYYPTPTIMDLAKVIAGCEQFISNQGLPHALAEAMKKNLICEVFRPYPAAIFKRDNAQYV